MGENRNLEGLRGFVFWGGRVVKFEDRFVMGRVFLVCWSESGGCFGFGLSYVFSFRGKLLFSVYR